jgi:hypothetical protein
MLLSSGCGEDCSEYHNSKKGECKCNQIKLKHSLETLFTTRKLKYFGYIKRMSHSMEKA